jgi:serine protease Do
MKHFLRPYRSIGVIVLTFAGVGIVAVPMSAGAQSTQIMELLQGSSPLLLHTSSQGYLGVDVADVDQDKAQALKLKEVRGAIITLIDHDAPAGQIGLKVNDVVLQLNGQNVEGAEQLRRMLREIPAGRKVSMEFSRDGNVQTTSVQLVDRRVMERDVWNKLGNDGDALAPSTGMGVLTGGGDAPLPGMFHMPIWGSTLNVGAMVEPLSAQTADYLGVPNGLMVKHVVHKSEAAAAGFKEHDVILKVGPDAVTTLSDWDRTLRANQGKQVQVTILRDRKQQILMLQVDSKHKTGALQMEQLFAQSDCPELAELNPDAAQIFGGSEQSAQALRNQAETLKDQLNAGDFKIDQMQMDELMKKAQESSKNFSVEDFQMDAQQAEQMRKAAEALRNQLETGEFKIDQKQIDELKQQMEQFRKDFNPQDLQIAPY